MSTLVSRMVKTMMVMIFLVAKFALVITSSISSLAHTFSSSTKV